jgi:hypothetical protein
MRKLGIFAAVASWASLKLQFQKPSKNYVGSATDFAREIIKISVAQSQYFQGTRHNFIFLGILGPCFIPEFSNSK